MRSDALMPDPVDDTIMTLVVERGRQGLFYVKSPDVRGLLIAEPTICDALRKVPDALAEMAIAAAITKGRI